MKTSEILFEAGRQVEVREGSNVAYGCLQIAMILSGGDRYFIGASSPRCSRVAYAKVMAYFRAYEPTQKEWKHGLSGNWFGFSQEPESHTARVLALYGAALAAEEAGD